MNFSEGLSYTMHERNKGAITIGVLTPMRFILNRKRNSKRTQPVNSTALVLLLASYWMLLPSCDDPAPVQPSQLPDTTSHVISWQMFSFSSLYDLGPILNYVLAVSDTEIWLTGNMYIDTTILSTPHGYPRKRVNAFRFDGVKFREMLIEGIKIDGSINTTSIYGAFRSYGATVFVTSIGCTEIRGDSIRFHDLRAIPYVGRTHDLVDQSTYGSVFYYGGGRSFVKLVRNGPGADIEFESVAIPTDVPVASLAEIGTDQYYISCWWLTTSESHLWKYDHGELTQCTIGGESDTAVFRFESLWYCDNFLFAIHHQKLVVQNVNDESKFVKYDIPRVSDIQGGIRKMVGASANDIFIVGDFGRVFHFNGSTVKLYNEIYEMCPTTSFLDVTVSKNKVYIVGEDYRAHRAIFLIGTLK